MAWRSGVGMIGALLAGAPAWGAELTDEALVRAIDDIDRLYLGRATLDPAALLHAAADGLADDVPWLIVVPEGPAVRIRHGDGRELGRVTSTGDLRDLLPELREIERIVRAVGSPVDVDVKFELLDGLTKGLDKYSRVLMGDKLDRFDVRLKGTLVGIGATMRQDQDHLKVTALVAGGPAERGGLRIGDVLLRIDGLSTLGMPVEDASERIQGELDTDVTLDVRRGEESLQLVLTRAEVVVPNVEHRVLAEGVAYVKIDHFSQRTVENLDEALADLGAKGALSRGLVLDLRGNTGGSMKEAGRVADRFLTRGMVLRTVGPDGGKVANLQSRIDAIDDGDEPEIPLVVVVDAQSASASEILAGALVQLDRAILVGARTFGKGAVQRVYTLDGEARLKLTVAEYLLAGDRRIAGLGIPPDVGVGRVDVEARALRIRDFDAVGLPWDDVLPLVVDRATPASSFADQTLDLARRTVLHAQGWDRASLLEAAELVSAQVRAEQEVRLQDQMRARGLDWSAAPVNPMVSVPRVEPRVTARIVAAKAIDQPEVTTLRVEVENRGTTPLNRALVALSCDTFDAWDELVVPIGRIAAGSTGYGELQVTLAPDITAREDVVVAVLRAENAKVVPLGDEVLIASTPPLPRVTATVRLLGTGNERRAEVVVKNPNLEALSALEVGFDFPDGLVELVDRSARLDRVAGKESGRVELALRLPADAPATVPLIVWIKAGERRIASLPVAVPRDGAIVAADPPRISVKGSPTSAGVGPWTLDANVSDDRLIAHVEVFVNGRKVAWSAGGRRTVDVRVPLDLAAGSNRIVIRAEDDQGALTRRIVQVRGEASPAAADGR